MINILTNKVKKIIIISTISLIPVVLLLSGLLLYQDFFKYGNAPLRSKIYTCEYTGNRIKSPAHYVTATYLNNSDESTLKGISKADSVFEYISYTGSCFYKAIFHDSALNDSTVNDSSLHDSTLYDSTFNEITPVIKLETTSKKLINELNFSDIDIIKDNNSNTSNSIFATFNDLVSSNFIYKDNLYYHYKNKEEDIDPLYNSKVSVTNVIFLFTDDNHFDFNSNPKNSSGLGLLFNDGKYENISWNYDSNKTFNLFDENGALTLKRGNSWYLIINKNSSVAYK